MSDQKKHTVIEDGTEFDGTVKSDCPISLSGKVKGKLNAPSLMITPTGSVKGKVKVGELRSEGEVSGELEAGNVELAGKVCDQTTIRAKNLEVKLSQQEGGVQVSFGNCELQVGDVSAPKKGKQSAKGSTKTDEPEETFERDIEEKDIAEKAIDLMT